VQTEYRLVIASNVISNRNLSNVIQYHNVAQETTIFETTKTQETTRATRRQRHVTAAQRHRFCLPNPPPAFLRPRPFHWHSTTRLTAPPFYYHYTAMAVWRQRRVTAAQRHRFCLSNSPPAFLRPGPFHWHSTTRLTAPPFYYHYTAI